MFGHFCADGTVHGLPVFRHDYEVSLFWVFIHHSLRVGSSDAVCEIVFNHRSTPRPGCGYQVSSWVAGTALLFLIMLSGSWTPILPPLAL